MPEIRRIYENKADFAASLNQLSTVNAQMDPELTVTVSNIVNDVRARGDEALVEYTNRFDKRNTSASELEVSKDVIDAKQAEVSEELIKALEYAANRIRSYAERQKAESWSYTDAQGIFLASKYLP